MGEEASQFADGLQLVYKRSQDTKKEESRMWGDEVKDEVSCKNKLPLCNMRKTVEGLHTGE